MLLEVQASYTAEPDNAVLFTAHTLYRIGSEGMELKNEVTNNSGLETIARVGQSFCLPAAFDTLTWYGKGPGRRMQTERMQLLPDFTHLL